MKKKKNQKLWKISKMFSIKSEKEIKITIEKSKFFGLCFFCNSIKQQNEILKQVKRKNLGATHVCYGSVFFEDNQELSYSSDDGEPSGTAGLQIANALKENKVINVLVVVVRYFGGIKLGVGGLSRAYKDCAVETLKDNLREVFLKTNCLLKCGYSSFDFVKKYLDDNEIQVENLEFKNDITFNCYLKEEEKEIISKKDVQVVEDKENKKYC